MNVSSGDPQPIISNVALENNGLNDNLLDKFTLIVVWMTDLLWGICVTCVDHTVVMMNWIISFLENFQLGWIRLTKFICLLSWIDKISYIDVNGDGDTRYITWRVSVRGKKAGKSREKTLQNLFFFKHRTGLTHVLSFILLIQANGYLLNVLDLLLL